MSAKKEEVEKNNELRQRLLSVASMPSYTEPSFSASSTGTAASAASAANSANSASAASEKPTAFPLYAFHHTATTPAGEKVNTNAHHHDQDTDRKNSSEVFQHKLSIAQKKYKDLQQKFSRYVKEELSSVDRKEREQIIQNLRTRANEKDKEAEFELGFFYYMEWESLQQVLKKEVKLTIEQGFEDLSVNPILSLGTRSAGQILSDAITWLKKAADQNVVMAEVTLNRIGLNQYNDAHPDNKILVTVLCLLGRKLSQKPLDKEPKKTLEDIFNRIKKTADLGNDISQFMMGQAYRYGIVQIGIPKDDKKAFEYYLASAKQDHFAAQYNLAICYLLGLGTKPNVAEALKWLTEAVGIEKARIIIDPPSENATTDRKVNIDLTLSLENSEDNESLGIASDRTDPRSNAQKADDALLENMKKLSADDFSLLESYALSGNNNAAFKLGRYFKDQMIELASKIDITKPEDGEFESLQKEVQKNFDITLHYMHQAIAELVPAAFYQLAQLKLLMCNPYNPKFRHSLCSRNPYLKKSLDEIYQLLENAAKLGHDEAQFRMGFVYHTGIVFDKIDHEKNIGLKAEIEIDLRKAFQYYLASAKQGNSMAQKFLAILYANGEGLKRDENRAIYWMTKAVGSSNAIAKVAELIEKTDNKNRCSIS